MSLKLIKNNFIEAKQILDQFLTDENNLTKIVEAGDLMVDSFLKSKKVISCGNGGSMCDAMHFAEELTGRFRENRQPLAAISISDPSHISCVGNDYGFDEIFSRYVSAVGNPGDVLLAISTSGNSKNVLRAVEVAKQKGIKVIALTGKDGGKLSEMCDVEIRAPHSQYSDRVQEIHIKVIHSLIHYIEEKLQ
ncbi:D-sedoheptulose 7-phosphate isomerase [Vicingus serpentipes]|uniref:Phosphoheptose isomerase n=1 Tax=Vicingus serpentipes TaxID=1926625 RepID=A0A5C6RQ02_9FLAO|nr:D-sedoheptulose 7-phosphate isomerase [Vicingus serpentipes]TXB64293.1 D-sedoheptulose 7-phosphate isomerase [Vicingus serpentipes]